MIQKRSDLSWGNQLILDSRLSLGSKNLREKTRPFLEVPSRGALVQAEVLKVNQRVLQKIDKGYLWAYLFYQWNIHWEENSIQGKVEKGEEKTFQQFRRDLELNNSRNCLGDHEQDIGGRKECPSAHACQFREGNPYCWHAMDQDESGIFEFSSYWFRVLSLQELCSLLGFDDLRDRVKNVLDDTGQLTSDSVDGDQLSQLLFNGRIQGPDKFGRSWKGKSRDEVKREIVKRKESLSQSIKSDVEGPALEILTELETRLFS